MNNQVLATFKIHREGEYDEGFDDFQVTYEILPGYDKEFVDPRKQEVENKISEIDTRSSELSTNIDSLNIEIERLTNNADGFDFSVAVASGVLCGLIDSFVVGEFDFTSAKAKSNRQVNEFISNFAKMQGYDGERLDGAIAFL